MDLVNKFLNGLRSALTTDELEELNTAYGATKKDIEVLRSEYPNCPASLISLLENIDGTYWRKYGEKKLRFVFLDQILKNTHIIYCLPSRCSKVQKKRKTSLIF